MLEINLKYTVGCLRSAGLEAKWSKDRGGRPVIVARYPLAKAEFQRVQWWRVDGYMFDSMKRDGVVEAFVNHTLLGDIFAI